ncbi:transposase [Mesorhizobium sp. M0991]|uniref:transposase n=1 Tax=Mesorhizobium sp. M0991 TaxID=2957043 RepID=UPI00333940B6
MSCISATRIDLVADGPEERRHLTRNRRSHDRVFWPHPSCGGSAHKAVSAPSRRGEVLNLLEIEGGVPPLLRNQKRMQLAPAPARRHPMTTRIPAPMRTRQSLSDLIEGRLSTPAGRSELMKLATRLIVEEALEVESRDAVGRDYYEHGAEPGQGYRNGVRSGRLKTAEGFVEYSAPQVAGRDEPFRSEIREHLKGRSEALEDLAVELLARGLSVRDIEDAFRDETGRLLLSKSAVSEIGERLWADYQEFATRDLGEYEIAYLFIAERLRPGQKREPVLAAWGFTASGAKVLLHLMARSKEDARR